MLAALRTEHRNPTSYLARLSRDVLNYYLVNQYTLTWLEEATWSLKTEVVKLKHNTQLDCLWKELMLDGRLLIFHSNGYFHLDRGSHGFRFRYYQYGTKIYFNFNQNIVRINLAFQVEQRWRGQHICLTAQDQLVITDYEKYEPKLLIFDHPAVEEPRSLLMPPEFRCLHVIGYGMIYLLSSDKTRLSVFSLASGQLLRQVDMSELKLRWSMPVISLCQIESPHQISFSDEYRKITLIAGK